MVAAISAVPVTPDLDISVYPADPALSGARPAVLVLPGGGFRVHGAHGLAVDTERVGVIGSSAGGHLAGLLLAGTVLSVEDLAADPPRPDFAVLAYALADLDLLPDEAVAGLLGHLPPLRGERSPARHLDDRVCPTFVWATAQDPPGLPTALAWTQALADVGAAVELHVYPRGGHGLDPAGGVRYGDFEPSHLPHTAQWSPACETWLREQGLL